MRARRCSGALAAATTPRPRMRPADTAAPSIRLSAVAPTIAPPRANRDSRGSRNALHRTARPPNVSTMFVGSVNALRLKYIIGVLTASATTGTSAHRGLISRRATS